MNAPEDTESTTTTCLFFVSIDNPADWGVTLKCFPRTYPSQYIWKYSWSFREGGLYSAAHCKAVTKDVVGNDALEVEAILNNYRK